MTTNHTPGPWHVFTIDSGARNDEIVAEVGECLVNIAEVLGPCNYSSGMPDGQPEPEYQTTKAECAANADLLAAAPDLLAALEQAIPLIAAYANSSGGDGAITLLVARAAIAKARGE